MRLWGRKSPASIEVERSRAITMSIPSTDRSRIRRSGSCGRASAMIASATASRRSAVKSGSKRGRNPGECAAKTCAAGNLKTDRERCSSSSHARSAGTISRSQRARGLWNARALNMGETGSRRGGGQKCLPDQGIGKLERLLAVFGSRAGFGELHQIRFVAEPLQLRQGEARCSQPAKGHQKLGGGAFKRLESVELAEVGPDDLREAKMKFAVAPCSRQIFPPQAIQRRQGPDIQGFEQFSL